MLVNWLRRQCELAQNYLCHLSSFAQIAEARLVILIIGEEVT